MTKLNQIIAVANGKKTGSQKSLTDIYQKLNKTELFSGISRVYHPDDDGGETLPSETKLLQMKSSDAIGEAKRALYRPGTSLGLKRLTSCLFNALWYIIRFN
jgi:hypothetical protein